MSRKLTYEFVKESFESEGYTLLSKEYINNHTKLNYRCYESHEHSIDWNHWQRGHRCITCFGNIKYTIDQVRESFEKEGYILISKEYANDCTKLDYRCSNNHIHSMIWNSWQQGHRCPTCSGQTKPTIEEIILSFKKENYILISKEYIDAKTKLNYICSNKHEHSIIWRNWKYGVRCPTCANINNSGINNSSWKGGLSYEPYCPIWSDKEYKQYIRDRDGNKCLNPYCSKNNSRLTIHHIDYNKKNCSPSNLITVCSSCNSRANTDRDWHTTWYQALVYMRYNNK